VRLQRNREGLSGAVRGKVKRVTIADESASGGRGTWCVATSPGWLWVVDCLRVDLVGLGVRRVRH